MDFIIQGRKVIFYNENNGIFFVEKYKTIT